MEKFTVHTGIVGILNRGNIDTDQIISKEFLKSIRRTGFGDALFHHWKFLENGKPNPDFELNRPEYKGASILITGNNFGCGSSREHAVWSVVQAGYQVVIAPQKTSDGKVTPGFADIFKNNSSKNGLLLLEFSEAEVNQMLALVEAKPGLQAKVDLQAQTLEFFGQTQKVFKFEVDAGTKERFLLGLDDIGQTEQVMKDILTFEKSHNAQLYS